MIQLAQLEHVQCVSFVISVSTAAVMGCSGRQTFGATELLCLGKL